MITIGQRASLTVLREKPVGLFLDAQNLGEILLPRREMPKEWDPRFHPPERHEQP